MISRALRAALAATAILVAAQAAAQTPSGAPRDESGTGIVTIFTSPVEAHLKLDGSAKLQGRSPLDLPPWLSGRYSVLAEGEGVSRTQGVLSIPGRSGERAFLVSEPPGLSAGLLVRSLNFPGIPDITAKRASRGLVLAAAGAGGIFAATRAHFRYRDRLDEFGDFAADRAQDERTARNDWMIYTAAVWGASAIDYWVRPRFDVQESTPNRVTIEVPPVGRTGIAWRSLVVPGAGQTFANHATRGTLWLTAFLAAGAGFTIADGAVERNQTQLDWARVMVDSAGPSERVQRLRDVEVRRNDLQSSEDVRKAFRLATLGIYAANVIDALVVPIRRSSEGTPARVSAAFPVGPDRVGVSLSYRY